MRFFILAFFVAIVFSSNGQSAKPSANIPRPKLVVGIVVDQMRWDYLYRYYNRYSEGGFKKLLNGGFSCENTFIPYTPTYTAAGHSCIFTGSVPAIHGIMGNNWYSRSAGKTVYCTEDNTVATVGGTSEAGKMSPANLWTTTITDELRLASNFRSKVIGIALKDRGAILPAGHSANAAYWFDNAYGGWISSTYYMNDLPKWVKEVNDKKLPDAYMAKNWNTLYPITSYAQSTADTMRYEADLAGEDNSFPHMTSQITKDKYNAFRTTPFGNTYTMEMAKAAIIGENLGNNGVTDFLTVSFSSTDYIGHAFGPNSIEIEDTYLRLDADLSNLFTFLDQGVGRNQYTVFLTADHGAAHVPTFLKEHGIPAGATDDATILKALNAEIEKTLQIKNAVSSVINYQVYLNYTVVEESKRQKVTDIVIEQLLKNPAIASAFRLKDLSTTPLPEKLKAMLTNGYNMQLSGDVHFIFKPQWFDGGSKGTTHGVWYAYDSHIPLLWYGWGIKQGKTNRETYMTDIAATIAALLHIQMPSGCIGKVVEEVVK
jgi:predicted AlkP superfamily pyrophosphatase or phosphodiesterase